MCNNENEYSLSRSELDPGLSSFGLPVQAQPWPRQLSTYPQRELFLFATV